MLWNDPRDVQQAEGIFPPAFRWFLFGETFQDVMASGSSPQNLGACV